MRFATAFAGVILAASPVAAQVYPTLGKDTPRIQSVEWRDGQSIVLTALPESALTVLLERGEVISKAVIEGSRAWDVKVSGEPHVFQVTPEIGAAPATLSITTSSRSYKFALEASVGLQAAYIVRVVYAPEPTPDVTDEILPIEGLEWSYRVKGDRSVRPALIKDNGTKTVIEYAPGQALPAVFAIGPSGDEEVVDGYMRGGRFVIDRIHQELIFRIDKEKARAKRNERKDGEQ